MNRRENRVGVHSEKTVWHPRKEMGQIPCLAAVKDSWTTSPKDPRPRKA